MNSSDVIVKSLLLPLIMIGFLLSLNVIGFSQVKNTDRPNAENGCKEANIEKKLVDSASLFRSGEITLGKWHAMNAYSLSESRECKDYWKRALNEFQLAIENGEKILDLEVQIGNMLYWRLKDNIGAIRAFENVLGSEPSHFEADFRLTVIYISMEKWQEALVKSRALVRLGKHLPKAFYEYYEARALEGLGRFGESRRKYKRFIKWTEQYDPDSQEHKDALRGLKEVERRLL